MDMIYEISKSKDILLSSIARALDEKTKKTYTIDGELRNKSLTFVQTYCIIFMLTFQYCTSLLI